LILFYEAFSERCSEGDSFNVLIEKVIQNSFIYQRIEKQLGLYLKMNTIRVYKKNKLMKSKRKSTTIINALLIGLLIGIVIYSLAKNSIGFFTLIPLYFIYRLVNKPKKDNQ